jgi:uncharacterized protein (DUF3084 family)
MELEQKLLKFKASIEQAKSEVATHKGKLEVQMERLKELGCSSVEDANKKIKELDKKVEQLDKEIKEGVEKFETEFGW